MTSARLRALRVLWWAVLTVALAAYVWIRFPDISANEPHALDVIATLAFVGLLFAPLFNEVNIFGLALKRELAAAREELRAEISSVRAVVSSAMDVRNTFAPSISMPRPASDERLKALEEQLAVAIQEHGLADAATPEDHLPRLSDDEQFLIAARRALEAEVRRIVVARRLAPSSVRSLSFSDYLKLLRAADLIDPDTDAAAREVYIVASQAVHGQEFSESQLRFAREVFPRLRAAFEAVG